MKLVLFAFFAIWPLVGMVVLYAIGRVGSGSHVRAVLPPAHTGGEVLARMYLWPLVLLRVYRGRRRGGS